MSVLGSFGRSWRYWHQPVLCLLIALSSTGTWAAAAEDPFRTTVGMPAQIDQVVLPGPELEVRPLEDPRTPVILRIVNAYRHGTSYRYDLVYYGLEPGTFDLRDFVRRKDGSPATGLPPLRVVVLPVLPPGQVQPNALAIQPSPRLGGYRLALIAGGLVWGAGLIGFLLAGRRRRKDARVAGQPAQTVADRLRPLVESALAGRLSRPQEAELERTLLAFWRRRLGLEDKAPAEAMAVLRTHPEASALVRGLEAWLHRPGPPEELDVAALLRPYQDVPAEEAGAVGVAGGKVP
ncbi:MAG: hypothetical protein JO112_16965 [Planctomycetes bacterium]|nr:hypothetical protein [Planctomycetota bacterium]